MKAKHIMNTGFILLLSCSTLVHAQNIRAFNQNASLINRYYSAGSGFNLTFSPLFSTALNKSNDSLLFRGNGGGFRIDGDYFFGNVSIGFSSGFGSSAADNNSINRFLQRINISPDQVNVTKSSQQNMYLLLGPSVRLGNKVELLLHAKGGLFINNAGLVMIQQKGSAKALYMNVSTGKSIYPGFQTGFNIQYSTKSNVWSFGIGADYMGTQTEINNYDVRRNGGLDALKLSRTISDFLAGINVRYNIAALKNKQRYSASQRVLPTVNKIAIAIDEPDVQSMMESSCGPVTMRTTNPDGSVSETTFACAADAAAYSQQLPIASTTSRKTQGMVFGQKQSQGVTFGERVQQGLHKEGIIHRDLAARNILVGKVSLLTGNVAGIETNETISSMERKRPGNVKYNNTFLRLYARETGSGMATGRKQYQPVFSDNDTSACADCVAAVVSNPLYQAEGAGENPLYENDNKSMLNSGDNCNAVANLNVFLVDPSNGAVLASTKTEACGDFFFANLPSGQYVVKITGTIISKKGYDVHLKHKADIAGELESGNDRWMININTGTGTAEQAAAVIKTKTKSNQSNDRVFNTEQDKSGIVWSPHSNLKVVPITVTDGNSNRAIGITVGNNSPGILPMPVQGAPLKGVGVSLGKTPGGGVARTTQTNENGAFEFTNLKAGNYKIIMEQTLVLHDETVVRVGDDDSVNNKLTNKSGLHWPKGGIMLDGSHKNNLTLNAQNNNTVRSNPTDSASIMNNDNGNHQNNITIDADRPSKLKGRSNTKNVSPVKWMAPESMKTAHNASEDNLKNIVALLDEFDQQLNVDNCNS